MPKQLLSSFFGSSGTKSHLSYLVIACMYDFGHSWGLKAETHVQPYDSWSQMCIPLPGWKHIRVLRSQQRQGPQLQSFSAELHLKLAVWGARAQMLFLEFSRPRSVSHDACKHRRGRTNLIRWTCKMEIF